MTISVTNEWDEQLQQSVKKHSKNRVEWRFTTEWHEQLEQSEMESFKRVTGTVTVKTELKEQLWQS